MHLTILTKLKRQEITVIDEIISMDFENDIHPNHASILETGVKTKNKRLLWNCCIHSWTRTLLMKEHPSQGFAHH